jgi:iron complex transport system ATP-binding protein
MTKNLITINNLTTGYEFPIIKDVSFGIKKGEILGIIGPNGSGKTTLLKSMATLLKPMAGSIKWSDKNIQDLAIQERFRLMAMVSQKAPEVSLSVKEYVTLGRIPHFRKFQFKETAQDKQIVARYLQLTKTSVYENKLLSNLSGGERQLIFIARALVQEPQLLLLDEPTTHLDIAHQITILDLLKTINKSQKITMVIVLHDLNLAAQYCDRICLLDQGEVVELGSPNEVLSQANIEQVYKVQVEKLTSKNSANPFIVVKSPHN